MNVRLTGELEQIIREKVESGEFANAEAVVAASLRQFGDTASLREPLAGVDQRLANIEALFDEADRNPPPRRTPLPDDAFDRENLYAERRELARAMTDRLSVLARGKDDAHRVDSEAQAAPEVRARLAALGYVTSSPSRVVSPDVDRPDPKECIGAYDRMRDHEWADPRCGVWVPRRR